MNKYAFSAAYINKNGRDLMLLDTLFNGDITDFLLSLVYSLPALVLSLSFHEFAHAYAAFKQGDPTAKLKGRLTLDPFSHIDPIGILSLALLGFGWAKPVPVNEVLLKRGKKSRILVSLAGVITNFMLANIFIILIKTFIAFGITNEILMNFLFPFVSINIVLMVFNLLPIPPLDGYRVLSTFINTYKYPKLKFTLEQYGHYILIIALVLGLTDYVIYPVMNLVYGGLSSFYSLFPFF